MIKSRPVGFAVAVLQVAAVYIYFLLFDQFGFLHHLHTQLLSAQQVKVVMAAMGIGGLVSSFITARLVTMHKLRQLMVGAWSGCALAAVSSLLLKGFIPSVLEGALIGVTTGAITVMVAAAMKEFVSNSLLGLSVGLGTAIAYAIANLPAFFDGDLMIIAGLSVLLSVLSAVVIRVNLNESNPAENVEAERNAFVLWPWVLGLAVLVCLDSGAFAILQQDDTLKSWTWGPIAHKPWIATFHFTAAVIAGFLLDRGFRFFIVAATWVIFALAFQIIPHGMPDAFSASLLYAVGISCYSVVLVAIPSLSGGNLKRRANSAAWLFGISGWVGSAVGVGMAQDNAWIPPWLIAGTGLVILVCVLAVCSPLISSAWRVFGRALTVLLACGLWLAFGKGDPLPELIVLNDGELAEVQRGAEVYRREGCINCHSQYIRPNSMDETFWGPYSPIDRTEKPPLVGNRRQGPDLKNIGLRRSGEWLRVHFMNPRSVSPGSQMPGYSHLFQEGVTDGEDLVAYLTTRGISMRDEYLKRYQEWKLDGLESGSASHGAERFQQLCSVCHGTEAKGNGPTGQQMNPAPRDLTTSAYIMANPEKPNDALSLMLGRIIKYGLPGASMPGHEVLPDQDIADLVHFIASLKPTAESEPR